MVRRHHVHNTISNFSTIKATTLSGHTIKPATFDWQGGAQLLNAWIRYQFEVRIVG
jgi:hypothetical protein